MNIINLLQKGSANNRAFFICVLFENNIDLIEIKNTSI